VDFGKNSAIHEIAELVVKIKALNYSKEPRTSYNVGTISGGTSVNTIAAEANLQLDLRSVNPKALDEISNQVEVLVKHANQKGGEDLQIVAEVIG
jgi:metal-dependent amidase/aminoacylase/carboxypeptidase family protein